MKHAARRSSLRSLNRARRCLLEGDAATARAHCQTIPPKNPLHADSLRLTALSWAIDDDPAEAVRLLTRALRLRPQEAAWYRDLGVLHSNGGRWAAASRAFAKACRLNPTHTEGRYWHAQALAECGRFREAIAAYDRSPNLLKSSATFLRNRAGLLVAAGNFEDASVDLARGLELEPESLMAHELMADCEKHLGSYERAMVHREAAAKLDPGNSRTMAELALACFDLGEIERSVELFQRAEELGPLAPPVHSIYLNALLHHPASTAASLLAEHTRWADLHCPAPRTRPFANDRSLRRKLRIGYITGQFISVPTCHFFLPIFLNHDPAVCETYCYHARPTYDPRTEEYRRGAAHWRDVQTGSDEQVAARIRRDRIDILVDLSGHYPYHRLGVFALRAAPVQVAFPNYPSTTGVREIDYIITDEWTTPAGSEGNYAESPVRLPSGYLPYQPPPAAPREIGPLPAAAKGYVTFGLFQRASKMNPGFWDAAAAILRRVPRSVLMIHYSSRDLDEESSSTRTRFAKEFERRGVDGRRVRFRGPLPLAAHLALLAEMDIALDTFPYNGQTTACECLWMGVPVVTLAGDSHVSRVGRALLQRIGLPEWVARDKDDYVDIAVRAGSDLTRLAALRTGLRDRVAASSLLQHRKITSELEGAYREMWGRWVGKVGAGSWKLE